MNELRVSIVVVQFERSTNNRRDVIRSHGGRRPFVGARCSSARIVCVMSIALTLVIIQHASLDGATIRRGINFLRTGAHHCRTRAPTQEPARRREARSRRNRAVGGPRAQSAAYDIRHATDDSATGHIRFPLDLLPVGLMADCIVCNGKNGTPSAVTSGLRAECGAR